VYASRTVKACAATIPYIALLEPVTAGPDIAICTAVFCAATIAEYICAVV